MSDSESISHVANRPHYAHEAKTVGLSRTKTETERYHTTAIKSHHLKLASKKNAPPPRKEAQHRK